MKNEPTDGMRFFNLDFPGALVCSWLTVLSATAIYAIYPRKGKGFRGWAGRTMIQNESLDIAHNLAIALMGISCHREQQSIAVFVIDGRGM